MRILDLVKPKQLSRVAQLQLLARGVVEGFCSGRHRSPHKGFSVEFKEHRPYVRGDELKKIDWKAFGKSDRLYIREFEEETNLRCTLLVDKSGSMAYGGKRGDGKTKYDYAVQLAASLTYLMLGQQDSVGLIMYDDEPREQVPLRSRPSHLQPVLEGADKQRYKTRNRFRRCVSKAGSQTWPACFVDHPVRWDGQCRFDQQITRAVSFQEPRSRFLSNPGPG